ncbi:MAG: outer membrane beta-barrel protein [Acidobacteriota bacterium]
MHGRFYKWLLIPFLWLTCGVTGSAQEKFEVGLYGGGSFFSTPYFVVNTPQTTPIPHSFVNGGVLGVRVRENITDHFGLEQSFSFLGNNNIELPGALVGSRFRQFYFNANLYGYEAESKVRPYFSTGVGWSFFSPTDDGKASSASAIRTLLGTSSSPLDGDNQFHVNFGGGLKFKLTDRFGLDFSARDFVHKSPTLGFASASDRETIHNFQLQGGFLLFFGEGKPPVVHNFSVAPTIEAENTSLCPGDTTTLRISATNSIPENRITYKWTVKGQEVAGSGPEYRFTAPGTPGQYEVGVQVFYDTSALDKRQLKAVKKNPGAPVDRMIALSVKEYKAPQASVTVDRASVQRGERVRLTGEAVGSECSGQLSYRWTVDKGRLVSGANQASAELDTSDVGFSETQQGRQEQRVLATLQVTDQKGGKATASKEVLVSYEAPPPAKPKAIQLSDINFGRNSARVNNCAKRVLANELYSQMTDSRYRDYDIVLVGHRDAGERETLRGRRRAPTLDRERVLNTAAFLTGKGDTCKDIELTRIRVSWVGADQSSEFKSTFCDVSTRERRADSVSRSDEKAKNRRVEIWLVPKGADLPSGIGTAADAPRDEIIKKGCPR